MRLNKENFLVQVKYSDILADPKNSDKYFLGFGGELYLSPEEIDDYDPAIIAGIKSFVKDNALPLRLHAPIAAIDYSRIREAASSAEALYSKTFRLCRIMDINSVVTHAEFARGAARAADKELESAVSLWRVLAAATGAAKINLNIENHYEAGPDCLLALMERMNSPYIGMCVDVGHYNAFSALGTEKWLEKYPAGSIKEVHLSDNKGDDDTHLRLGGGNFDFAKFFNIFSERNEDCAFVLEPRSLAEARNSLAFLRKRGFLE